MKAFSYANISINTIRNIILNLLAATHLKSISQMRKLYKSLLNSLLKTDYETPEQMPIQYLLLKA